MESIKALMKKERLNKVINKLKENNFIVKVVKDEKEAESCVLKLMPKNSSVSMGGSVTLNNTELLKKFREEYNFFERFLQPDWESTVNVMRESLLSDFLVTSTNAITENGELLQIDSGGNRVAGMAYGPKNVIVVCGVNKIVKNRQEGYERLYYVGPLNSKRLKHNTPCNFTGKCENCSTHMRMCNFVSIIRDGKRPFGNVIVILIEKEIGY